MPQAGGGGGQEGGSNTDELLYGSMALIVVILLLWYFRSYYFPYIFALKYYELTLVNYIYPVPQNLFEQLQFLQNNPTAYEWSEIWLILQDTSWYYKYPICILLVLGAVYLYFSSTSGKCITIYNMKTLLNSEKALWPQTIPIAGLNLIDQDISKGPWASALTPILFVKKYKLVELIENPNPNPLKNEKQTVPKLLEAKTRQLLAKQLGHLWTSIEDLPIHRQALIAAFLAIGEHKRKEAYEHLHHFNRTSGHGKTPDFSKAKNFINKYKDSDILKKVVKNHSYVLTVIATLLELARIDGVVPTADFLWLKPLDRPLWYMLNNIGRKACFAEAAGPFGHWKIEKRMNRKIITPMVDEAVIALKFALEEVVYDTHD
tara:strand:+ start:2652 stop:3776 length:1125 start_codon:yes stop_codon:yes gene_type:complete